MIALSLLLRQLQTLVVVMLVFIVTVALALGLGLSGGLGVWKESQGESIHDFVREELLSIHYVANLDDGEAIEEYLSPFLDPSLFLFVFNIDQELIFSYWKGDSWYLEDERSDPALAAAAGERLVRLVDDPQLFPNVGFETAEVERDLFTRLESVSE